jgi:hypothetical protein
MHWIVHSFHALDCAFVLQGRSNALALFHAPQHTAFVFTYLLCAVRSSSRTCCVLYVRFLSCTRLHLCIRLSGIRYTARGRNLHPVNSLRFTHSALHIVQLHSVCKALIRRRNVHSLLHSTHPALQLSVRTHLLYKYRTCSTNIAPCSTNIAPCSTNIAPCSTNIAPCSTNIAPCSTNIAPSLQISQHLYNNHIYYFCNSTCPQHQTQLKTCQTQLNHMVMTPFKETTRRKSCLSKILRRSPQTTTNSQRAHNHSNQLPTKLTLPRFLL